MGSAISNSTTCFQGHDDYEKRKLPINCLSRPSYPLEFDLNSHKEYILDCKQLMDETHRSIMSENNNNSVNTALSTPLSSFFENAPSFDINELQMVPLTMLAPHDENHYESEQQNISKASTPNNNLSYNFPEEVVSAIVSPMSRVNIMQSLTNDQWCMLQSPHFM